MWQNAIRQNTNTIKQKQMRQNTNVTNFHKFVGTAFASETV